MNHREKQIDQLRVLQVPRSFVILSAINRNEHSTKYETGVLIFSFGMSQISSVRQQKGKIDSDGSSRR